MAKIHFEKIFSPRRQTLVLQCNVNLNVLKKLLVVLKENKNRITTCGSDTLHLKVIKLIVEVLHCALLLILYRKSGQSKYSNLNLVPSPSSVCERALVRVCPTFILLYVISSLVGFHNNIISQILPEVLNNTTVKYVNNCTLVLLV